MPAPINQLALSGYLYETCINQKFFANENDFHLRVVFRSPITGLDTARECNPFALVPKRLVSQTYGSSLPIGLSRWKSGGYRCGKR